MSGERLPYRAVVADDEPEARRAILTLLRDETRVEVVGEAGNGEEAVERVRTLLPDLLFLDVQMPDLDGFGVLESLGDDVPAGVIFVTAHDEYALRAFDVHALDYLLKPFGRPRFQAAVDRALRRLGADESLASRRTVSAVLERRHQRWTEAGELTETASPLAEPRRRRLGVRVGSRIVLVPVDEIDWVEADGDYVRVNAAGAAHLLTERLHALEATLVPHRFLRIHRSVLVNLDRVRELHREPDGSGYVLLETGVRLRVSRGRWEDLAHALGVDG
ncbi:MAG TPA: LytTR family DNA-binding domain-containing protein [Longimicrobiales bacterium]|nr:LytTR family DNA-binding domain-containing protein [Longimicrobiales bacterium]